MFVISKPNTCVLNCFYASQLKQILKHDMFYSITYACYPLCFPLIFYPQQDIPCISLCLTKLTPDPRLNPQRHCHTWPRYDSAMTPASSRSTLEITLTACWGNRHIRASRDPAIELKAHRLFTRTERYKHFYWVAPSGSRDIPFKAGRASVIRGEVIIYYFSYTIATLNNKIGILYKVHFHCHNWGWTKYYKHLTVSFNTIQHHHKQPQKWLKS